MACIPNSRQPLAPAGFYAPPRRETAIHRLPERLYVFAGGRAIRFACPAQAPRTASGSLNTSILLFAGKATSSTTAEAVRITDNEVVLPVYKAESPQSRTMIGYTGSVTLKMDIVIMSSKVVPSTNTNHPGNWVANNEAPVTFVNGIATLDGGDSPVFTLTNIDVSKQSEGSDRFVFGLFPINLIN
jgi:hypothetical protein